MSKINVVYWSQTGNTEEMAEAIGKGITQAGGEAVVSEVSAISPDALKDENVFALGCPAMGAEVLEEAEMEPFVEAVESFAAGKKIALFGSYGWGDGEWMRDWVDRMQNAGAEIVNGEGLICQEAPNDEVLAACEELGKQLVQQREISMSVVIVGGHDRMVCQYKKICKGYKCKAKIFTQMSANLSEQIGSPDLLILFTNTVSHKMVKCAITEAEKCNAEIVRCHTSSKSALNEILQNACVG